MRNFNALIAWALTLAFVVQTAQAQDGGIRYVDQVFDEVEYTPWEPNPETGFPGQFYGQNATILSLLDADTTNDNHPLNIPLWYDLYQPKGDTVTERPLAIVFHTGNFLPFPENLSVGGTVRDSTVIETCTRLAKMGYVAVAATYRTGWIAIAPTQDQRNYWLINAAYRGVQDARTAVRFFKMTAAALGNPYRIASDKIVLWGIGTGGYVTLNTACLDDYNEVLIPKFITTDANGNPLPMVIEQVNGDIEGKTLGLVPPDFPIFETGDTLNYPQWVDFSSDFQLAVNMGGALGDSSWVDADQPPIISFHDPGDQNAPYLEGIVNVPVFNLPVVEVQGSYIVQKLQNEFGTNAPWAALDQATLPEFTQQVNAAADSRNDGFDGLLPMPTDDNNGAPWDFWAADNPNATEPADIPAARMAFDSIMAYFAPRACVTLDLDDCLSALFSSSIEEARLQDAQVNLVMAPNPADEVVNLQTDVNHPIQEILLYDMSGRLVQSDFRINEHSYQLQRQGLMPGMYILRLRFEEGVITKKVVFR